MPKILFALTLVVSSVELLRHCLGIHQDIEPDLAFRPDGVFVV